jgi:hypothetical protein
MKMQKKYNKKVLDTTTSKIAKENITQNLVLCAHAELSYLIENTNYKKHHITHEKNVSTNQILFETVDVVRYMMSIMNIWDISSERFCNAYIKKDIYLNEVNRIKNNSWDGNSPVAIIDIDDVLAEFRSGFASWISEEYNIFPDVESKEYYFIDALNKLNINPEKVFFEFVDKNGFYEYLKPVEGALLFLEKLKDMGYWIHLLTARPDENANCFYDTYHWLKKYNFCYDDLSFSSEKFRWCAQSKYYDKDAIKFAIDDSPKHATEYAKHGICVKVPKKSYNKSINIKKNIEYYNDFEDLISKIKEK